MDEKDARIKHSDIISSNVLGNTTFVKEYMNDVHETDY